MPVGLGNRSKSLLTQLERQETCQQVWQSENKRIWKELAIVIAFLLVCFVIICTIQQVPVFPLDDAYIMLHSAQVLHSGFDENYPGVHPLFGTTSAPFLALVSLLLYFFQPLTALNIACWLGLIAYALGLRWLGHTFRLTRSNGLAVVALGLLSSYALYHLWNGLETSWALAAITWTLALASGYEHRWLYAALAAGVAASFRPDLLPFAVLVTLVLVVKSHRQRRYLTAVLIVAAMLAPLTICALWYFHGTGLPFPETGIAKRYFFAEAVDPLSYKLAAESKALLGFVVSVGPLLFSVPQLLRSLLGKALLLFIGLFCVSILVQFPGAMGWNYYRYPIILIPILVWSLAVSLTSGSDGILKRLRNPLLVISLIYSLCAATVALRSYIADCRFTRHRLEDTARWCEKNLPSDATLLVHDAGYIAYATHFHVVDMVGLKTPSAIPLNRNLTWQSGGDLRSTAVSRLADANNVGYLILLDDWPPTESVVRDLPALGWNVRLMRDNGAYSVFKITPTTHPSASPQSNSFCRSLGCAHP
jgi:hypothetical protein